MRISKSVLFVGFFGAFIVPFFLVRCKTGPAEISIIQIPTPADNPMSAEKIALGRALFFDKRLSIDESISCASCHMPELAFTDQKKVSTGVKGRMVQRNAPSLLNSAFLQTAMFDAHLASLEVQVLVPIQEHTEMDIAMNELLKRLRKIEKYQEAAKSIFNRDFDAYVLTRSIAAFERSLISMNSRFDQYQQGKKSALSKEEQRGWDIFSNQLYCTKCHPAPYFTTFVAENNGLYTEYGEDRGRFRIHGDTSDIGKFKVPSLRNIALTFPYMHDGNFQSIEDVLKHYAKGGAGHPNQNALIQPFQLSERELKAVKAFLFSLTDTSYMVNFR
jgi:cytochrome c peroxidase